MKKIIMALLVTGALFTSCKKDDDKTNQEKVEGTWTPTTFVYKVTTSGSSFSDTTKYSAGSTVTFKTDGAYMAHSIIEGDTTDETGKWMIGTDGKLVVISSDLDSVFLTIKTLNSGSMVLYQQETSNNRTDEGWFNFKR